MDIRQDQIARYQYISTGQFEGVIFYYWKATASPLLELYSMAEMIFD